MKDLTRREFLEKSLETGGALGIAASGFSGQKSEAAETVMRATDGASERPITREVFPSSRRLEVAARVQSRR